MSRLPLALSLVCALTLAGTAAQASGGGGESKGKDARWKDQSLGVHNLLLPLADGISNPVTGLQMNVSQVSYPGVPERSSCRTVIRFENRGDAKVSMHVLVRTFDSEQQPLGTWMVPSGELGPDQAVERLYSCKLARYLVVDRTSAAGWPNVCKVDGDDRSPCPVQLELDTNIDLQPGGAPAKAEH